MTYPANDQAKLAKVLALTDSDQEAEALAALRSAKRILQKSGTTLADWLTSRSPQMSFVQRDPRVPYLEQQLNRMRSRLEERDQEMVERKEAARKLSQEVLRLRQELNKVEQDLERRTAEAKEWRNRAWSNLWLTRDDLGK